jgi:cytochrome b561
MPATGMAMGYYGGNGIPFYGLYTIPGIPKDKRTKEDGAFAGQLFKWHKWLGSFIWYLVPLHVAGAAQHMLRGHAIWGRIVPGIKPA